MYHFAKSAGAVEYTNCIFVEGKNPNLNGVSRIWH